MAPKTHDPDAGSIRVKTDVGVVRGRPLGFDFDGSHLPAFEGETVAAALFAAGVRVLRTTSNLGEARGVFCGMGTCYDCLVVIDGQPSQRACMVPVRDGMVVQTQDGHGQP